MLPVSSDFQTAISAPYRRLKARVVVDYDPYEGGAYTTMANDFDPLFDVEQATDGVSVTGQKTAVLDGTWRLGEDRLYSPAVQNGWWTHSVCDASGVFTGYYPVLSVQFAEPRPIGRINIVGDTAKGEYPIDFTVRLRDEADHVITELNVTDNDTVVYEQAVSALNVKKIELEIHRWSQPKTRAKITELAWNLQETYEDEIIRLELTEERELYSTASPVGNISMNELRVVLANDGRFNIDNTSSPLYGRLRPGCRVRAWIGAELTNGTVEWIPLGTFYTTRWRVDENNLTASFTARDRLQKLTSTYCNLAVSPNTTLYDVAVAILQDAGLTDSEYKVDESLRDIPVTVGKLPDITHLQALKMVAQACLGVVYVDRYGVIQVKPWLQDSAPVATLTADNYFRKQTPLLYDAIYTRTEVYAAQYKISDNDTYYVGGAYTGDMEVGDEVTLTITWDEPYANLSYDIEEIDQNDPQDPIVVSTEWDNFSLTITLRYPTDTDTGTREYWVRVHGAPVELVGYQKLTAQDDVATNEWGLSVYRLPKNPLLQDKSKAQEIADTLLQTLKDPLRAVSITWPGNPAWELGDKVVIDDAEAYIVKQVITYDGGLVQKTETRKVGEI